ncbi:MAG TPA: EAL domain-containing protein [Methylophilaceae bacterium]|nr:EAL domain-containing protein [Methylophilaceae bacterium]
MNPLSLTYEFESCGIPHVAVTPELRILQINPTCASLFGESPDELLGRYLHEFLPMDLRPKFNGAVRVLKNAEKGLIAFQVENLVGKSFDIKGRVAKRDASGDVSELYFIFIDKTEVGQIENQLEEKTQLIDSLYGTSLDAIILADNDGRILEWRGKAEEMFGWKAEEVLGQYMHDYIIPEHYKEAHLKGMRHFIETGESKILNQRVELDALRKSGDVFPIELSLSQIKLNGGAYFSAFLRDISHRKENEAEIWHRANYDPLTGLPNRRMFEDHLCHEVKLAQRMGFGFSLLFIDLDHFKEVNDSFGHSKGDDLLKIAATRLVNCVRTSDVVARLGGDEFVILLSFASEMLDVEEVIRKIHEEISKPFEISGNLAYVTASIGVTSYPTDGETSEELMNNADQAMYEAKKAGRNTYQHFNATIKRASAERVNMANDLHEAVRKEQLALYFQPILDLKTGKINKVEALIRWFHPRHGLVSPGRFIPIAEEHGLFVEICHWMDHEVIRQLKDWRELYGHDFQISINKSPMQFLKDLTNHKRWIENLALNGLEPHMLCIEITEGVLLNPEPIVIEKLDTFRDAGVEIALDDFGTGYSSMLYLKDFPIDVIKIDRSFVGGIAKDSKESILCEAMILMAHKLGIKVIGEGVETEFQKDFLLNAGCDYMQGYISTPPLPPAEFEKYMELHKIQ